MKEVHNPENVREGEELVFECSIEAKPAGFTRFLWFIQQLDEWQPLLESPTIEFELNQVSDKHI